MTFEFRKVRPSLLSALLPFVALLSVLSTGCGSDNRPISGEIPSVTLEAFSGESFTLDPTSKEATLLVFWASWCMPCLMEIPALVSLHGKYKDRGFQVISINVDEPAALPKAKRLAKEYGINYPSLVGNQETMRDFGGVNALPTSFLVRKDGRIREKLTGLRSEEELERKILEMLPKTAAQTR
jgi:thiol-disulfide isomerase/thioredoxin